MKRTKLIEFDNSFDCSNIIVCIGEFDGIHIGHSELVKSAVVEAKSRGYKSAMISFLPHPDYVFNKRAYEGYLTTVEERLDVLSSMDVDYLIVMDFAFVCSLEYDVFYDMYLSSFGGIVAGFDFKFGYKGLGSVEYLKNKFDVCRIIDKVDVDGVKVSSRNIRELIRNGDIVKANELLGRAYSIYANVDSVEDGVISCTIDKDCFLPADGTYKCEYLLNKCEICSNICIIEKMALKILDTNVELDDVVKISLLERIESGV